MPNLNDAPSVKLMEACEGCPFIADCHTGCGLENAWDYHCPVCNKPQEHLCAEGEGEPEYVQCDDCKAILENMYYCPTTIHTGNYNSAAFIWVILSLVSYLIFYRGGV